MPGEGNAVKDGNGDCGLVEQYMTETILVPASPASRAGCRAEKHDVANRVATLQLHSPTSNALRRDNHVRAICAVVGT